MCMFYIYTFINYDMVTRSRTVAEKSTSKILVNHPNKKFRYINIIIYVSDDVKSSLFKLHISNTWRIKRPIISNANAMKVYRDMQ